MTTLFTAPPKSNEALRQWKQRFSGAGVHLFDRNTGLNILLDEIAVPAALHSRAPRQISIALTNRCDLACAHCYAPKSRDELRLDTVTRWLAEFDVHPELVKLCQYAAHYAGRILSDETSSPNSRRTPCTSST